MMTIHIQRAMIVACMVSEAENLHNDHRTYIMTTHAMISACMDIEAENLVEKLLSVRCAE